MKHKMQALFQKKSKIVGIRIRRIYFDESLFAPGKKDRVHVRNPHAEIIFPFTEYFPHGICLTG